MEAQFRELVKDNSKFSGVTLESLCALPDEDIGIYFDTSSIAGTNFKGKVLALRKRLRDGGQGVDKTFTLVPVQQGSAEVQEYVDTGNRLKRSNSSGMDTIESGITTFVDAVKGSPPSRPAVFAYVDGSSGLGKTQMAFALKRKVLYVPLGSSQEVYRCFDGLSRVVAQCIALDKKALRATNIEYNFGHSTNDFTTDFITRAIDKGGEFRYFTVELLLKMLEEFVSPAAAPSDAPAQVSYDTNVFLGAALTLQLNGMTLDEGRAAAQRYRDVLIHIDEVPKWDPLAPEPFLQCLLLRNIIRCMGLPCLLSGTESTLLDAVEFGRGSRREGRKPWAWLLARFPATELSEQLTELTDRCGTFEKHVLRSTRPLFVQWFASCHSEGLSAVDAAGNISMTPATLSGVKVKMCEAKLFLPDSTSNLQREDYESPWLHASTLLVFADSLQGSSEVASTVSIDSTAPVGAKRSASPLEPSASLKKKKIADNVYYHTLLIRKHFALLYIPADLVMDNSMTVLHFDSNIGVCYSNGGVFTAKAAFQTCSEDPLLYLAGLRNGIVRRVDAVTYRSVPSSYAFTTFREQRGVGNRCATSNDGSALEAECAAALVLAAHRYTSFAGTPFFTWLARVIAELHFEADFNETEITDIPQELDAALKDVMVPLLSPPNSEWGDSMGSGINFSNFSWCKNQEQRDASAPLINTKAGGSVQGEGGVEDLENGVGWFSFAAGTHHFTALGAEIKDVKGFGGKNMISVTKKVAESSVSLLIGRDLCDWAEETIQKFAQDVSVYRMNKRGAIVHVSPPVADWEAGRKVLIALDLKRLHRGREEKLPHAT